MTMTLIRIEPTEMEAGCRELAAQAEVVSQVLTGTRADCSRCCLPNDVASSVDGGLATLEQSLTTIRAELFLESMILAVRGILAVQGSDQAGQLVPDTSMVPTASFDIGPTAPVFTDADADGAPSVPGPTGGGISMAELDRITGGQAMKIVGLTDSVNPFAEPSRGGDFENWRNSRTLDTDRDGVRNNMDLNPGRFDREYTDHNPSTQPSDY
jgi:hypothetical protein